MKHFYIALYMLLLPCLFAVENANLVDNPGAERLDEKGKVVGWRQVKYNPVGELFIDKGSPKGGANSFGISCTEKPSKPLGWGFYLEKKAFDGIAPGSPMTISFDLTTFANPSVIVRCYAEFKDGNNFVGTFGANHSVYAGWERKQFTFPMLTRNYTSCIVYFMLKSEGKACIDNVDFRQGVSSTFKAISDDYCRVKDLPPRRTWFYPARPAKLDIEYKLSKPELKVTLAEIDGKELQTWTFDNLQTGKTETQTIELPSLPEGAYELIFKSGELDDNEWFAIRAENNNNVHFTSDGFLIFKGKPVFPIAIAHPNRLGKAGADGLRVYAESGVNLISEYHINGPKHAAYLNAMTKQFGFMLWLKEEFGSKTTQKGDALRSYLNSLDELAGMIDNFIGVASDEAAWNSIPLESIRRHSKYRFKYMPNYFTWQNNAPRMTNKTGNPRSTFDIVRRYALAADLTSTDIYPVPEGKSSHNDLPNQTLSCIGDYTDLTRKLVWNERPVWMVLQGMSWREEQLQPPTEEWPRPTKEQLRFMVWNAVTHGATGICWYGHGVWTDQYSEWYREFADVNLELSAAAQIMLSGKAETAPKVPEQVGTLARTGIRVFVNENGKEGKEIEVDGDWHVCPTGEKIHAGRFALKPYGVLILAAEPLIVAPAKRFVPQKTEIRCPPGISAISVLIDGNWAAHPDYISGSERTYYAKHAVRLEELPESAVMLMSVDDKADVTVNGKKVTDSVKGHYHVGRIDLAKVLKKGENLIEFRIYNGQAQTGVVFSLDVDGKKFSSGEETMFSLDGKTWKNGRSLGRPPTKPWGTPYLVIDYDIRQ